MGSTGASGRGGLTDGLVELTGKARRRDVPCMGRRSRAAPEFAGSTGGSRTACSGCPARTRASVGCTRRRCTAVRRTGACMGTAAHSCGSASRTCPSSTSRCGSTPAAARSRAAAPSVGTGIRRATAAFAADCGTPSSLERAARAVRECMGHLNPSRGTRRARGFMGRSRRRAGWPAARAFMGGQRSAGTVMGSASGRGRSFIRMARRRPVVGTSGQRAGCCSRRLVMDRASRSGGACLTCSDLASVVGTRGPSIAGSASPSGRIRAAAGTCSASDSRRRADHRG